jgi:hypothetical protein
MINITHVTLAGVDEVINWVLRKPGLKGRNGPMHDHTHTHQHVADSAATKTAGAVSAAAAQRRSLKDSANAPPAPTPAV